MTITVSDFKVRFPEFATQDDARIQMFLDDAYLLLNECYWGDHYELGIYYRTAHYLSSAIKTEASGGSGGGGGGPVSSKSVDGSSVSYATYSPSSSDDAFYSSTPYGVTYLSLSSRLPIAAAII